MEKKSVQEAAEATVSDMSEFEKLMSGPTSTKARNIDDFTSGAVAYLDNAGQTLLAAMARGKAASVLKERIASADIWGSIKSLKGLASGFATDERPAKGRGEEVKYTDSELQDAIVDALLDGAMLSDCEINIISGRKYLGVSYYRRKLSSVAKDIAWAPGIPTVITTTKPGYDGQQDDLSVWRVPATLRFTPSRDGTDGKPQAFDHSGASAETPCVAVQYRGYKDTIDAAIGKAERKLRKRAYEMCVGKFTADDEEPTTVEAGSSGVPVKPLSELAKRAAEKAKEAAAPATTITPPPMPRDPEPPSTAAGTQEDATPVDDAKAAEPPDSAGDPLVNPRTFGEFHATMGGLAMDQGIDGETFDAAWKMLLLARRWKGYAADIACSAQMLEVVTAARAGQFDWTSGKVL